MATDTARAFQHGATYKVEVVDPSSPYKMRDPATGKVRVISRIITGTFQGQGFSGLLFVGAGGEHFSCLSEHVKSAEVVR